MLLRSYKEKELIIFEFDKGKRATYNLNTGETIGKQGKPVQSLCSALAGIDINDVLNSFNDEKYRNFLKEILHNYTPHTYGYSWNNRRSRVENLGTLFKYVKRYKIYEQYYIADLNADSDIRTPLKDVPKGLLKLCREQGKLLTDSLIRQYTSMPNAYQVAFNMEFENFNKNALWDVLSALCPSESQYWRSNSSKLLHERKYNLQSLLKYMDYLATFENVTASKRTVEEIGDYANMMWQISEKYEKYPRYFLSTHRIATRNFERLKHQFDEINFQKQRKPEYEFKYKDFIFIYPKTTQEIKDEAVQQSNCVASYIQRVIDGSCHILFLRHKDFPNKSLVTIEVRNGKIVQALQAYNRDCTPEQHEAVEAFNKKFSKG